MSETILDDRGWWNNGWLLERGRLMKTWWAMSVMIRRVLAWPKEDTDGTYSSQSVVKVVLWSRGCHLTKPGWSKPHTHSNPTNLALFRHKITLYRFNQGAHTIAGGSNGSRGLSPPPTPVTLTTVDSCRRLLYPPVLDFYLLFRNI